MKYKELSQRHNVTLAGASVRQRCIFKINPGNCCRICETVLCGIKTKQIFFKVKLCEMNFELSSRL